MITKAWLTIDDSPSPRMDDFVDFLVEKSVPAIFFCRGDLLEENAGPVERAIQNGFVIGNHLYRHKPAGDMTFEDVVAGIEKTEQLIAAAYERAGVKKPGRYFRFPYLDRGDGDRLERRFPEILETLAAGKTQTIARGDDIAAAKRERIAQWLRGNGYIQPWRELKHPLYRHPEIAAEPSCLFTYSTGDWMMNSRHVGRHGVYSARDLMARIDADLWLQRPDCTHAILIHDQEEVHDVSISLVDYFLKRNFAFQPIATTEDRT